MGLVELVATKIGDGFIRFGRVIHSRWAVVPADVPRERLRADRWRSELMRYALWADPLRFSQRAVVRSGLCTRPTHETYLKLLQDAGLVLTYPKQGTYWAHGWDRRKFSALLRRGLLQLPYPADREPPPLFKTPRADAQLAQFTRQLRAPAQVSRVFASDHGRALQPGQLVARR